jgi:putative ABC transport system permease protein
MKNWLQDFEYRVEPEISLFIYASIAALLIAVFTTSFQSLKAARLNPVKALRNE